MNSASTTATTAASASTSIDIISTTATTAISSSAVSGSSLAPLLTATSITTIPALATTAPIATIASNGVASSSNSSASSSGSSGSSSGTSTTSASTASAVAIQGVTSTEKQPPRSNPISATTAKTTTAAIPPGKPSTKTTTGTAKTTTGTAKTTTGTAKSTTGTTKTTTGTTKTTTGTTRTAGAKSRKERPCDACRRRKSRCVMNEGVEKCVLCQFHSQECTFVQSPQPRKRRMAGGAHGDEGGGKKRSRNASPTSPRHAAKAIRDAPPITDYSVYPGNTLSKTLGLQGNRHSHLVGPTAEYESFLIDLCPFDSKDEYAISSVSRTTSFRRVFADTTFTQYPDELASNHGQIYEDLDRIERTVAPHGKKLFNLYFRVVHPSFPILHRRVIMEKYARTHREFSPPLLAAVYILALHWWAYDPELATQPKPDARALDKLATKTMADVIHRPKLSTVQAGLLLLQRGEEVEGSSWAFTAQLVAVGQELGLHLDCTNWRIPQWEKGLRKRLAWGLFMQDKWGALTYGRPTHIAKSNWAVRHVEPEDFPDGERDHDMNDEEGTREVETGRKLFEQMVQLSELMAVVLETFFTLEAQMGFAGKGGTQKVLERAKPIQIKLKEWFVRLPECLRMDVTTKNRRLSSTGYLHLAYFATEITLHRQILRTLSSPIQIDPYLLHICRSAAKTRLISAMDFVNRLRPEHLRSFWYFSSKVNFALIGTFGSLLWATSPSIQEAEFYKARLSEYRWTLQVSSRGARFMEFAAGVLDASAGYLQQEQWKKRGPLVGSVQGYQSTVGSSENIGLGMGVGTGSLDLSQPILQPPTGLYGDGYVSTGFAMPQKPQQRFSLVRGEDLDGSEDEYDDAMMDDEEVDEEEEEEEGYSDETGDGIPPLGRYMTASAAVKRKGSAGAGFAAYQANISTASTPTSNGSSSAAMDFFMIPNTGFGSGE